MKRSNSRQTGLYFEAKEHLIINIFLGDARDEGKKP
jgi:hypothetical protein